MENLENLEYRRRTYCAMTEPVIDCPFVKIITKLYVWPDVKDDPIDTTTELTVPPDNVVLFAPSIRMSARAT